MASGIYLDTAATTPVDPRVRAAMEPYINADFGNPSSIHALGRRARHALDKAREIVAVSVGAEPSGVIFTSGGTEADNLALVGTAMANPGGHLALSSIEHHAVLDTVPLLNRLGCDVTFISSDDQGRITPDAVQAALCPNTVLVSVMHGNNEVGTLQPITEIATICRERGVLLHSDAVQSFGYVALRTQELGIGLSTLSAHKIYGPKGVGALIVEPGIRIEPLSRGGGQERGKRGGTENVAGIVGFATAVRLLIEERETRSRHVTALRDLLESVIASTIPDTVVSASHAERLPHISHVRFNGVSAETLLIALDRAGVAASSGSACSSGSLEPSHVLLAMGCSDEEARSGIRFSVGKDTTKNEVNAAVSVIYERVVAHRAARR